MTEAVTANAGTDKTQAAAQSAQSGEEKTLAQLLAEGQTALQKTELEKKPTTEATTSTPTATAVVDEERVTQRVTAQLRAKESFDGLVRDLTSQAGVSKDTAEAIIERELSKNAGVRDAWLRQFVEPDRWAQVSKALLKERAAEFDGLKKKGAEQVSDRAAVRAGANLSPSAEAPPEKRPSLRSDPKARGEFLRKHGLAHG